MALHDLVGPNALDGWLTDGATWTFASSTTFTVSGDQTAMFSKGTRLKLTQTTVKYFVVTNSSHSAGTTTVTLNGGTDYTLANAAISANYFSYAVNPQGYPDWFNYSPTWTGSGGNPAIGNGTITARFRVVGRMCLARVTITMGSTTTYGSSFWNLSVPIAVAATWGGFLFGSVGGSSDVSAGTTYQTIWRAADGYMNYWSNSPDQLTLVTHNLPVPWANTDILNVVTEYEF